MEFSFYVKCLKGLYEKGNPNVTLEKLTEMVSEGKITEDEFAYITGIKAE